MTPGYVMGFQQPIAPGRLTLFAEGKLPLMDAVLLMQDLIEAGRLPELPPNFFHCAQYCVDMGYCTTYGRLQH